MKSYKKRGGTAPLIFNLSNISYTFWPLYLQKMSLWHTGIVGWIGSAEGHDTAMVPPSLEPQHVTSHFTD
jgi:hypothetical protein